jgi:hypothetical protein
LVEKDAAIHPLELWSIAAQTPTFGVQTDSAAHRYVYLKMLHVAFILARVGASENIQAFRPRGVTIAERFR